MRIYMTILIMLCAGCGISKPLLVWEEPGLKDLRPSPLEWKVELLKMDPIPAAEIENDAWQLDVDSNTIGDEVVSALREAEIFSSINRIPDNADLLMKLKINYAKVRYLGSNEYRIPWFLVWCVVSSIPASFIADEEYEAEMNAEVSLTDKSGKIIWHDTILVKFSGALDHFQRGISFWDLFLPGPFLAEACPHCLSDVLTPHIIRTFEIELAKRMAAGVPPKQIAKDDVKKEVK